MKKMRNTFINLTVLLAFMVFIYSCKSYKKNDNDNLTYSKIEIYCACMNTVPINNGYTVISNCSSPGQIPPSRFIKPEVLYYSTIDTGIINSLKNIFFRSSYKSDTLGGGTDARFVVLMKKSDFIADTLVFNNQTVFTLNEKYRLEYSINIIDSIRKIIGKERIDCE